MFCVVLYDFDKQFSMENVKNVQFKHQNDLMNMHEIY